MIEFMPDADHNFVSECESLDAVDVEFVVGAEMVERSAQEVFSAEGHGEQFEESLHGPHGGGAAADVVDEDESAARP